MRSSRAARSRTPSSGHVATRTATAVRKKPTAKAKQATTGKKASAEAVYVVEVRPAGLVVKRRPLNKPKREAVLHVPHQHAAPWKPPAWMLEQCHIAPARAVDQSEVLQLLSGLPQPPTRAEFHAAVDHPDHDSANRLVARLAGRIVGHVEVMPRAVLLGDTSVSAAVIDRLAVLPECRGAGHGQELVRAAE